MVLMYKWNNMEYSLEYLISGYPHLFAQLWKESLLEDYKFCVKEGNPISLSDLVSEASDGFEELCHEKNLMIEFVKSDDEDMDFNVLLEPII